MISPERLADIAHDLENHRGVPASVAYEMLLEIRRLKSMVGEPIDVPLPFEKE